MDYHHMKDIELEDHGTQSAMHNVRKSINLNLTKKTKLKAKSSVSKVRTKREREDDRRGKKRDASDDEREGEELDWSHKIMFAGEKVKNSPMIHICENCNLPIVVYGRLNPCKHVFCLTCAEKCDGRCLTCDDDVKAIEQANVGQIYVCSFGGNRNNSSACRRSYLSKRDLIAHVRHRHEKEGSLIPESELLPPHNAMHAIFPPPPSGLLMQPGFRAVGNPVMIAAGGLPPRQVFLDSNRMPIIPTPTQPYPQLQQSMQFAGQPTFQYVVPSSNLPPNPSIPIPQRQDMTQQNDWSGGSPPAHSQDWANQQTRNPSYPQQPYYK